MGETAINSHVQMPKSFLKRFEDKGNRLFYYDVQGCFIGNNGHAASINTISNYYSADQETFLNKEFESKLPDWVKRIDNIGDGSEEEYINSELEWQVKLFIYMLLAREPSTISQIKKLFVPTEEIPDQLWHDFGMMMSLFVEAEVDFLKTFRMTVVINATEVPFILPQCGVYGIQLFSYRHVFLPVSPKTAIAFVEEAGTSTIIHDGIVHPYSFLNPAYVELCNMQAVKAQSSYNCGCVVSCERDSLEKATAMARVKIITHGTH